MQRQKIIIIGGGICGLYTASLLVDTYDVIILEANSRLGGRIWDEATTGFDRPVRRGAEFIHGEAHLSFTLLKDAGIEYKEVVGKMYSKQAGAMQETEFFVEGWDELMHKMKQVQTDITLQEFLEYYFKDDKYAELKKQAMRYAEGYDIADPNKVSVMALYKEWSADEATYQLDKGYGPLIDHLVEICSKRNAQIHTYSIVKEIEWRKGYVDVHTADGRTFNASKVVITVPLGVLQKQGQSSSVTFKPTLDIHIAAAQKIGFGSVVKASLEFHNPFWKEDTGFIFGDQLFQTWWTQLPYQSNTLTGWAGGVKAKELSLFSEDELRSIALSSIAEIFDLPLKGVTENLKAISITNWEANEWTFGAYSYPTPASKKAREILSIPADSTVFFAGEGVYDGDFSGTVEAALLTAKDTVEMIINSAN